MGLLEPICAVGVCYICLCFHKVFSHDNPLKYKCRGYAQSDDNEWKVRKARQENPLTIESG